MEAFNTAGFRGRVVNLDGRAVCVDMMLSGDFCMYSSCDVHP